MQTPSLKLSKQHIILNQLETLHRSKHLGVTNRFIHFAGQNQGSVKIHQLQYCRHGGKIINTRTQDREYRAKNQLEDWLD